MLRGRAFWVVLLLVAALPPLAQGGSTFGALTVTAPDWQLITMPGNQAVARTLFQSPGDVNGDGFGDLIAWRGQNGSESGFVLFNGSSTGLDLSNPRTTLPSHGVPGSLRDTGTPFSFDSRPTGVDANGDAIADVVGWYSAGLGCGESPDSLCTFAVISDDVIAFGNSSRPLHADQKISHHGPGSLHLIGPVRPGTRAAILVETFVPRGEPNGPPAMSNFSVWEIANSGSITLTLSWHEFEQQPPSSPPGLPHFIAAPDFNGDGLVDIVTWRQVPDPSGGPPDSAVFIYNGSAAGPNVGDPMTIGVRLPNVVIGDFDGNGHADIASYAIRTAPAGQASPPYIEVDVLDWEDPGLQLRTISYFHLTGPSVFVSQPAVRLSAGDVDGDGADDLIAAKYDTTSATSGHVLVDVYLGIPICNFPPGSVCSDSGVKTPSFSSEIQLTGSDIYANDAGLRLNAQGDYDGDGRRDIAVGYFGGNAPERTRTSTSGFVAVLSGSTVARAYYKIWIDTDPGLTVHPDYRNYTIRLSGWATTQDTAVLRVELVGLAPGLHVDINQSGALANSSDPSLLSADGPATISHADTASGAVWSASVPVVFHRGLTRDRLFGLRASFVGTSANESAYNSVAGRFSPAVAIMGDLNLNSGGRSVLSGQWVKAGVPLDLSNLSLVFADLPTVGVPLDDYQWAVKDATGTLLQTAPAGPLAASVGVPSATARNVLFVITVTGRASGDLDAPYNFTVNADADAPAFGGGLPLPSEWATSSPVLVAVDIFDNESGVNAASIEISWENDGAPFVRWTTAQGLPGETPGEVVGRALLALPEGNLSNVIWRASDLVGNGPRESPIFSVKVDTRNLTFTDPAPAADAWQPTKPVNASVRAVPPSSGIGLTTIAYRASSSGLFGFGPWTPPSSVLGTPSGDFRLSNLVSVEEGDDNWVEWRAESNAHNGLHYSNPYQIRVDTLPPVFVEVTPNATVVLPMAPVNLQIRLEEGSPAGTPQRGLDLAPGAVTYHVRPPGAIAYGEAKSMLLTASTPDRWSATLIAAENFARGNNTVLFFARELGGRTIELETTVRINQVPNVTVESQPPGLRVDPNGTITLTAVAVDPEGLPLRYLWGACEGRAAPLSRNASISFGPSSREPYSTATAHNFTLCLRVTDVFDDVAVLRVEVRVGAPPLPPPPPARPTTASAEGDVAPVVLLFAVGAAAGLIAFLRRRRSPPDNV